MKKILYITNIEVPYRVRMFNRIAQCCDLTVLYERKKSDNRDDKWTASEKRKFKARYLNGIKLKEENIFSFGIFKYIFSDYDEIIFGCCNSIVQLFAMQIMRIFRKKFILNIDGEIYLGNEKSRKIRIKRFLLKGAYKYLVAGEKSAERIKELSPEKQVVTYYFSSLNKKELERNKEENCNRNNTILVVGQYYDYKGMDIALEVAKRTPLYKYKFVGMGKRNQLFISERNATAVDNVEIIPFLSKEELEEEYKNCGMLLLPSRQECWGLVINEAASFGMPIVSTWGSGAAVEFLSDKYPEFLGKADDVDDLCRCVEKLVNTPDNKMYSDFLKEKSREYYVEKCADVHMDVCGIEYRR